MHTASKMLVCRQAVHQHCCVMQAVALVFEHVRTALTSPPENGQAALLGPEQEEGPQRKGPAALAQQGAANAALKLLDDLCMMTTGITPLLNHPTVELGHQSGAY